MAQPPGDVVYGLDNSKLRSFLPSTANTFGGFPAPYVMLNSGCNTHLLSIPNGGLLTLFATFPTLAPNAAGEIFTYTIRGGGGVAALQSPVLCISNNNGNAFTVRLCWDLVPSELIHNNYLRFTLCYDDAVELLTALDSSTIAVVGDQMLRDFVGAINILRIHLPGVVIGSRRRHALLGRSLIGVGGRQMHFVNGLTIISANHARLFPTTAELNGILNTCTNHVTNNFGMDVFNDLEDDYLSEVPQDLENFDSWFEEIAEWISQLPLLMVNPNYSQLIDIMKDVYKKQ
eukprot:gene15520-18434_t